MTPDVADDGLVKNITKIIDSRVSKFDAESETYNKYTYAYI